jgi:hypothetical protein
MLTPDANAEVRRNLFTVFGIVASCLLLVVIALAVLINPPGGSQGIHFAWLMLIAFLLPVLAMLGACLTLAYPMGCWLGFMRWKRLSELYGIDASNASNKGMRRWMSRGAFWIAFLKGGAVGLAFIGPWFLTVWLTSRKGFPEGFFFPALLMIVYCGGFSAKAWVVRQLMDERIVA